MFNEGDKVKYVGSTRTPFIPKRLDDIGTVIEVDVLGESFQVQWSCDAWYHSASQLIRAAESETKPKILVTTESYV